MTVVLSGCSVSDVFSQALRLVVGTGTPVSPRGMPTREILDVHLRVAQPRARLLHVPGVRVINPAFAVAETVWILSGTDDPWIFTYNDRLARYADGGVLRGAYGPRLRNWVGRVDQLHQVTQTLREDPDSRRAVIQLYDPARDAVGHSDVPCTLGYRFHLRDGRLHMSADMRGQDVWTGFPYDLFATTVLHELMAGWLGAGLGEYSHHVGSLHIYEHDLTRARLGAAMPDGTAEMPSLAVPWQEFDDLLGHVLHGPDETSRRYPAWDSFSAVMHSYRLWKAGQRFRAAESAAHIAGPLGPALCGWYEQIARRAALATSSGR
jgi:thymidylate synthase